MFNYLKNIKNNSFFSLLLVNENKNNNESNKQQQHQQPKQYQSIKEEEMPQQSAAIQEKLKRFEQDTLKQSKYPEESLNKSGLIEDNKFNNRKLSPFETNKENSPVNTKPSQFNSQQTHTFQQPQQQNGLKRPVNINTTESTNKTPMTYPFQSQSQPNQQNYYYNKQTTPQQQQQLIGSSTAKLTDVNSSPARTTSYQNQNYKYSQLAPFSPSTSNNALSPLNSLKPNFFQKGPSPPSNNQIKSVSNEPVTKQHVKQETTQMLPKSPSQAFSNNNYEIVSPSWSNDNLNKKLTQPEYYAEQFIPASVSKRAALFEQQKQEQFLNQSLTPQNQSLNSSRRNSFNKSNVSPSKTVTTSLPKTQEDNELFSSSSSSSYKDSFKRQPSVHKQQPDDLYASNLSPLNEPSKLSLSEKLKLFSPPPNASTSSNNNNNLNKPLSNNIIDLTANQQKTKPTNKRSTNNRFQTQVRFVNYLSYLKCFKNLII